jgi:hypothetical protein
VYSRPYDRLKAYRKHPEATGYEEDLYAIHGAGDETANHLEGRFLLRADTHAAEALDLLASRPGAALDDRLRSAWSRFMMLGSGAYKPEVNVKGERLIWIERLRTAQADAR